MSPEHLASRFCEGHGSGHRLHCDQLQEEGAAGRSIATPLAYERIPTAQAQ